MKRYPEMRDSNVSWIGNVPKHWQCKKGKREFVCKKFINKDNCEKNILSLTLVGVVRNNFEKPIGLSPASYTTYQIFEKNDLVFKLIDLNNPSTSRVGLVPERGIMSPAYVRLVAKEKCIVRYFYLYYFHLWLRKLYNGLGTGVRPTLDAEDLLNIEIVVPPLPEQEQIVRFLDWKSSEIDQLISLRKKQISALEELKKAMISRAVTRGLDSSTEILPTESIYYPKLPKGWIMTKTLKVLSMPMTDGPHTSPKLYKEGIPFVSAEAVSNGNGFIDFSHIRGFVSQDFYEKCSKKYIPELNDIYMIKSGATIGKVAIVDTRDVFTIWSPLAVFRCNKNIILPKYMFYALQATPFQLQVHDNWSYGTQPNIGMRILEQLKIIYPPLQIQKEIISYLDSQISKINTTIKKKTEQIGLLRELKTRIISDVVTGKIDVRNIEIPEYEVIDDELEEEIMDEGEEESEELEY